ncbi:hypothetical protein, partial [Paraburkholderia tropica]|uniref:hypothetical protein n=1 Tax=Paraburkholderia tropica TaxID=92647 RepID=UPI002AB62E1D
PSAWTAAQRGKPGWERAQYAGLETLARQITVAGDINLYQALYTRLTQYRQHVGKLAYLRWPAHTPPQGYFLGVCRDVGEVRLIFESGQGIEAALPVSDRLVKWGPHHSLVQPPYVFLATIGPDPVDPARFALRAAYVHPVLDVHTLVPVDSDLERQTLLQLLEIGSWLERKKGVPLRVVKPLFNVYVPGEGSARAGDTVVMEPCRPDFVIEVGGQPVLTVESMGRCDAEYMLRKSVTHPRMERIAPVVTHETWRFATEDRDALNEQFRRLVAARILA